MKQQFGVLQRSVDKPRLTPFDRPLWTRLCEVRRPRSFPLEDRDLLPEGENFEGGVAAMAEEHADGGQD